MPSKFLRVMALSKTPADYKRAPEGSGESEPHINSDPPIVTDPHIGSVPHTDSPPRTHEYSRPKPRQARLAQDGHSHAEQAVYAALWDNGHVYNQDTRLISIGFGRLSKLARLSENNCRQNVRSLARKLALEEIKAEHSASGTGKTYRIFGYTAILQRRKAAGMEWVIRTKGVVFVNPTTGAEILSVPHTESVPPIASAPVPPTEEGGGPPTGSVAPFRNSFRNLTETSSSSEISAFVDRLRPHILIDDDVAHQLIKACRKADRFATADEILLFAQASAEKIRRQRNVANPPSLLIRQVANFFQPPATELNHYRAQKLEELEQTRETARKALEDPEASEEEKQWARNVLAS